MLSDPVRASLRKSVLCWLATCDADGQPNVSPKEVFCDFGETILIADIASPMSVRNILMQAKVCVSFIDVFVQRGFKVHGRARIVSPGDVDYPALVAPLKALAGPDFAIRHVIVVAPTRIAPIHAPSYALFPERSEAEQVRRAMATYGVGPIQQAP